MVYSVKPKVKKLLRWQNNPENADVIIEKRLCLYPLVLLRFHSVEITRKLKLELNPQVVEMEANRNWTEYFSWAATILLLVGVGFNTISCSKQAIRL
jgi:hypothetical protein